MPHSSCHWTATSSAPVRLLQHPKALVLDVRELAVRLGDLAIPSLLVHDLHLLMSCFHVPEAVEELVVGLQDLGSRGDLEGRAEEVVCRPVSLNERVLDQNPLVAELARPVRYSVPIKLICVCVYACVWG